MTGTTANGADLVAEYEGPTLATGGVVARYLDLYGEYQLVPGSFGGEVLVDERPVVTFTESLASAGAIYGVSQYGSTTYGTVGRRAFPVMLPLEAEGRTVQLKASYRGTAAFKFYAYKIGIVPEAVDRGF